MFTTLDGEEHKALKKVLAGPQWSIGTLRKEWEGCFDDQIRLLVGKLRECAGDGEVVALGDRVACVLSYLLEYLEVDLSS